MRRLIATLALSAFTAVGFTACDNPQQVFDWHKAVGKPITMQEAEAWFVWAQDWTHDQNLIAYIRAVEAHEAEVHADIVAYLAAVERFGSAEAFAAWVDQLHAQLYDFLRALDQRA